MIVDRSIQFMLSIYHHLQAANGVDHEQIEEGQSVKHISRSIRNHGSSSNQSGRWRLSYALVQVSPKRVQKAT